MIFFKRFILVSLLIAATISACFSMETLEEPTKRDFLGQRVQSLFEDGVLEGDSKDDDFIIQSLSSMGSRISELEGQILRFQKIGRSEPQEAIGQVVKGFRSVGTMTEIEDKIEENKKKEKSAIYLPKKNIALSAYEQYQLDVCKENTIKAIIEKRYPIATLYNDFFKKFCEKEAVSCTGSSQGAGEHRLMYNDCLSLYPGYNQRPNAQSFELIAKEIFNLGYQLSLSDAEHLKKEY